MIKTFNCHNVPCISMEGTGKRIHRKLMETGLTVSELQEIMGFNNPQSIYKWIRGQSIPSIDNLLILSRLFGTSIDDLIATNEEAMNISNHSA